MVSTYSFLYCCSVSKFHGNTRIRHYTPFYTPRVLVPTSLEFVVSVYLYKYVVPAACMYLLGNEIFHGLLREIRIFRCNYESNRNFPSNFISLPDSTNQRKKKKKTFVMSLISRNNFIETEEMALTGPRPRRQWRGG